MKKLITMTVITACLTLCAAVWPQIEAVEKTLTPVATPAVNATEPPVAEPKLVAKAAPPTEKEKTEILQSEPHQEIIQEPESVPAEAPAAPEPAPMPEPESTPIPTLSPAPMQTDTDLQPGDLVYVEGFGWVPYQGPNVQLDGTDIYENGNKIGIMG